jgi:hypothetical protein
VLEEALEITGTTEGDSVLVESYKWLFSLPTQSQIETHGTD